MEGGNDKWTVKNLPASVDNKRDGLQMVNHKNIHALYVVDYIEGNIVGRHLILKQLN